MLPLPIRFVALVLMLALVGAGVALAEEAVGERSSADLDQAVKRMVKDGEPEGYSRRRAGPPYKQGWNFGARGAWLHQFEAGIDDGGRMDVDRFLFRASIGYSPTPRIPLSISLGYRYDGYRFRGGGVFGAGPWDDIHSLRASIPLGFPLSKKWFLFALPTVRSTAESGARFEDGITWGAFGGAIYKVNPRFAIGPGVGFIGELEDDASLFPVLLIEWQITPKLLIKTGEGLGATQGPGLFLEYQAAKCWLLSIGGRYDRNRFRLDDRGVAPGGIGQETAFGLLLAAEYTPRDNVDFFASLGATFLGNLRLEDKDGLFLLGEDYDTAFFAGIGASFRF